MGTHCCSVICTSGCCAILLSRLTGNPDPRMGGSGNAGATNMLRLAGKNRAVLTLLGDLCKGLLPVLIAGVVGLSLQDQAWIGVCAVIGHLFPLYFRFRGGKGVATAAGMLDLANTRADLLERLNRELSAVLNESISAFILIRTKRAKILCTLTHQPKPF